ncbi:hypothetical protein ACKI10_47005, partial [Streptomyces galilaeus]
GASGGGVPTAWASAAVGPLGGVGAVGASVVAGCDSPPAGAGAPGFGLSIAEFVGSATAVVAGAVGADHGRGDRGTGAEAGAV